MKQAAFIFLFVLVAATTTAQNSFQEYKRNYNQAIQLYANSQYDNAIRLFLPLTQEKYQNAFVPYSHYYVALCSNNVTNFTQAKTLLRQLFQRFPDWDKLDEAYYLYAEASFNQKNYEEALDYLNRIQDRSIIRNVPDMEYKYLSAIKEFGKIKQLQNSFPNNKTIAEIYVKAVSEKSFSTREELVLSDELTNRFKLINPKKEGYERAYDDKTIDFGILLPFELAELASNPGNKKPYPYDLYIGMKIASDQLLNQGILTNIYAFDITNSDRRMMELVNDQNFKKIDLFVGPLYASPNDIAIGYAVKNKILQVHPLSNNLGLTTQSDGIFLAQPSFTDQSNKAISVARTLNGKKTVAIYYGNSSKDKQFAQIYRQEAENNGMSVVEFRQISTANDIDNHTETNHTFIAAMPDEIRSMIQNVKKEKNPAPIFTAASSFDFSSFPLKMLEQDIYIIYPEFIDTESSEVENFKDLYVSKMGELPTYYAYLGYDIALYYSRILRNGKENFKSQMNMIEYTQGYTLSGFDYTNDSKSNKLIPIIKYENGNFREITR
ncbi:MAG: ABC transporter substrate-binding protein [Spirosomaceae bacterium]|nr:ABC transporter substrate-binding protein [Spirosomataceae bacterium]